MTQDYAEILATASDAHLANLATLVEAALTSSGSMNLQPGGPSLKAIWVGLRREVFDLLCTDSKKYAKERGLLKTTSSPAIALISGFLTREFGLEGATAISLASLALLVPIRMATEAWCHASKDASEVTKAEVAELRRLRGASHGGG